MILLSITVDNYHFCVIISQFVRIWMDLSVALISTAVVVWIMGISYTAREYISLYINLDTTMRRWTLVRMREKGILLIIVIKCMPVSISVLGGKHDGLTDLYRETTSFANYMNSRGHSYSFLKTWHVLKHEVRVRHCHRERGPELPFSASTLPGQVTLVNFLKSFRWVYQRSFPFDGGIKMHGGPPLSVRIWKEKKNPVNMSDSRQARADAWLHSANHLLGKGSNETEILTGFLKSAGLITHN